MNKPLFVSIGTPEKLQLFLQNNPNVPSDCIFVDNYKELTTYKSIGFENFTELSKDTSIMNSITIRVPDLKWNMWWKYLTTVGQLAPIEKNKLSWSTATSFQLPEGGIKNGGTFVIQGDDVIYQWFDTIPGNYPNPSDVVAFCKKHLTQQNEKHNILNQK